MKLLKTTSKIKKTTYIVVYILKSIRIRHPNLVFYKNLLFSAIFSHTVALIDQTKNNIIDRKSIIFYKKPLFSLVIFPTIVYAFYILVLAPSIWLTSSSIVVKSLSQQQSNPLSALGFSINIGEHNSTNREDVFFLKNYIQSYDMFKYLDDNIKLSKLYRKHTWDPFSKLFANSSKEDALKYYNSKVEVVFDEISGILNITTHGFRPCDSYIINKAILERSEWFLNHISQEMAKTQSLFFESQIKYAYSRLERAKQEIITFQKKNKISNPIAQIELGVKLVSKIASRLAEAETQLKAKKSYLTDTAPEIVMLRSEISALKQQIEQENKEITGGKDDDLNTISSKFQELELEVKVANKIYESMIDSFEKNSFNVIKQFKSLVVVSSPQLPEEPLLPTRVYSLTMFFIVLMSVYGILKLVASFIKEYR